MEKSKRIKELIKLLGGTIEFINQKGQGTKYIIIKENYMHYKDLGVLYLFE